MAAWFSYAEQAGHYFQREHEMPAREPLAEPAAWRGDALLGRDVWRVVLDEGQREELCAALATAQARGRPTGELTAADFPLPTLAKAIADWREEIREGRGFLVVSGVPVERWSDAEAGIVFWCLGLHMGRPGAQNPQGDLLGHVADTGDDASDPYVRLYRTRSHIAYHCDAADVVGLLCLRAARRGGASRIASSVSVYNELLARRPDLIDELYEPFAVDVRNEDRDGVLHWLPIPPCRFAGGRLRTFWHSDYFRSAERHDDVTVSPRRRELLDLYDEIAAEPGRYLDMDLAPGDIQWLSNHVVIHSRTEYEDDPEPEKKRHLLRLWLSL